MQEVKSAHHSVLIMFALLAAAWFCAGCERKEKTRHCTGIFDEHYPALAARNCF
jgi:hypothetical protein